MVKMIIANSEVFSEVYEPQLPSGSYVWVYYNIIIYEPILFDIFDVIDFDELANDTPFELVNL